MPKPAGSSSERISRGSTLTEQVYEVLKRRVLSGAYPGGTHLVERQLAQEFGISKTPVREALARLEKERLMDFEAGRGMRVRSLHPSEVDSLLEVRELLEGYAAEKAAVHADEVQVAKMAAALGEGEALPLCELEAYKLLDESFHEMIWQASHNPTLVHLMESLRDQIYLVMSTTVTLPGRRSESLQEHRQLLKAIRQRDPQAAGHHARQHMKNARRAVQERSGRPKGETTPNSGKDE